MLAREFGWTIDEIKQLTSSELNAIVNELLKQKELETIADQYNHWAFMAAMIANAASSICSALTGKEGKEFSPDDFMVKEALNKLKGIKNEAVSDEMASLIQDAKAKGLKGPW